MNTAAEFIDGFIELFFPHVCITCDERLISQEEYLCLNCWFDLPVCRYDSEEDNKTARLFWGRVQIEYATSWFQYKKGSRYQKLIHFVKYKGFNELGFFAGKKFGYVLSELQSFEDVDLIVPVPLHPVKEKKRGFNQSLWIAMGIAEAMKKPVSGKNLHRNIYSSSQTRKSRYARWQNVEGIFGIHDHKEFENKHILLVDDVVTTGSTIEACANEILKNSNAKVSVATLAYAEQ